MADPLHADQLRALVAAVQRDGNRVLDAMAQRPPVQVDDAPPPLFAAGPGRSARTIAQADAEAEADWHRPYALTLAGVELALHGYCVPRRTGRVTFCLGRPPLWRRWLLPAPLLVLRFSAHGGAVAVSVGAARRGSASASGEPRSIDLDPVLQQALLKLHQDHLARRTLLQKLIRWWT